MDNDGKVEITPAEKIVLTHLTDGRAVISITTGSQVLHFLAKDFLHFPLKRKVKEKSKKVKKDGAQEIDVSTALALTA